MKIELSSLKSRIARRLFRMFFFILLVPISLIALGSYYKVSDLIFTEHHHHLQRATKEYGLGIFRRLSYAHQLLLNASHHSHDVNQIQPEYLHLLRTYFSNYAIAHDQKIIWQYDSSGESKEYWNHILAQEPVNDGIFTLPNSDSPIQRVFMKLSTEDTQWFAEIDETFLWPATELGAFEELCVIGADSIAIFCSTPLSHDTIELMLKNPIKSEFYWINENSEKMISASWSLFMRYQFAQGDWRIIISKPEVVFLQSVVKFKYSFLPAILLIFLLVVFVSLYMVRRHLKPVEALIEGTKALSKNKLDYKVEVNTDDEYEDLANSFNLMTENLTHEFEYKTALFNVNQKILLNEGLSSCAQSILIEINRFSTPLYSLIYILNRHNALVDSYYTYDYTSCKFDQLKQSSEHILKHFSSILKTEAKVLTKEEVASVLEVSVSKSEGFYHFYPVYQEGQLIAFLLINLPSPVLDTRYNDFLSHCTVAFNALQRGKLLSFQAYYDRLTGIYNRSFFKDQAEKYIALIDRQSFAILFIDLDRFKNINDTLGHSFGDELLKLVAKRLMDYLPHQSTLCRFGGDEFVLLQPVDNPSDSVKVAQQWIDLLAEHFQLQGRTVNIGASIGIALAPDHAEDYETLLTCADMAMYEAKSQGRNRYCIYNETLHNELARRTELETFLRTAVQKGYLHVHYQPKVNIQSHRLSGFEALARFHHPEEGFLPPDILFQIAEESGLVYHLGLAVMEKAFAQLKKWQALGLWQGRMAVNVSPLQLASASFMTEVSSLIMDLSLDPKMIELEITEGVFIQDNLEVRKTLQQFQAMGITIAMDDFGTGYSSMAYITQLPLDNLKIDKAFISNLNKGDKNIGIIKSMIQIAHNLGLNVTAEGVETQEELKFLLENGCHDIQGYLYSIPLSSQNAEALLQNPDLESLFKH